MHTEVSIQDVCASYIHAAAICRMHQGGTLCPTLVSSHYKILVVIDHYRPLFCIYGCSISVSNTRCNCPEYSGALCFPKPTAHHRHSESALQTPCLCVLIHFSASTRRTRTKSVKQVLTSYQGRQGHSYI